jgi:hypothetical protein
MAGFPMRRALEKKIEEMGGIEFVTAHISQGMTIGRLAEFIECSRPMLSFWITFISNAGSSMGPPGRCKCGVIRFAFMS